MPRYADRLPTRLAGRTAAAACLATLIGLAAGCTGIPDGVDVVEDFELDRYLGTWYEIARLDHRFERGLTEVTATYRLEGPGRVSVTNRGFDVDAGEWDEIEGRARFIGAEDRGRLKVSFFGPFFGAYNVIELDRDGYDFAMVCGPDRSYLWILSREPRLAAPVLDRLVGRARELGFDTGELIFVEHGVRSPPPTT